MQVAYEARVSTNPPQQEGTIESQRRALNHPIQHHEWSRLPEHEDIDEGISGARLDRPALDRLRDAARCGECDAVVIVSPDRLARNDAQQWLLIEAFEKTHTPVIFLHNPFGDTPQGKRLTQRPGLLAADERAQMAERPRRGRLENARRGEVMPWAYRCDGDRDRPKRHGCAPQVLLEPLEAEGVRAMYRTLVEEQRSCRQLTTRLNAAKTPPPTGKNVVWQSATVRTIRTNRLDAGPARDNSRRPVIPTSRQTAEHQRRSLKTGRSDRAESDGIGSDAPAMIPAALLDQAHWPRQRKADTARQRYQPASGRS
jgi:site-specific DNA recombinase